MEIKGLYEVGALTTVLSRRLAPRLASAPFVVIVALQVIWPHAGLARETSPRTDDREQVEQSLRALRRAWLDEIGDLTAITQTLAVSDDTYNFVARPNLPYVYDHYDRSRLASIRIDTVLIIDRRGKPLFWRRVGAGEQRGFPDARAFLARLPPLTVPTATGPIRLTGAVTLARGPSLVVALPIYPATGSGEPRGWLITGRTLDATRWHHYEEMANVTMEVLDPTTLTVDTEKALHTSLEPVLRVEAGGIRGLMSVPNLMGEPFRVFSVFLTKPAAPVASPGAAPFARYGLWPALASTFAAIVCITGVAWMALRGRGRVTVRTPSNQKPSGATPLTSERLSMPPAHASTAVLGEPVPTPAPPPPEPEGDGEAELRTTFDPSAIDAYAPYLGLIDASDGAVVAPSDFRSHNPAVASTPSKDVTTTGPDCVDALLTEIGVAFRYQPQIDLRTGRVAGVEALMCTREDSGFIPATQAIATLEALGVEIEVTERRLHEACSARRFWSRQIGDDFPVSVSVSQRNLADPAFLRLVERILADYELPPQLLELLVSEAALAENTPSATALADLHAAGVLIAIAVVSGR